MIKNEKTIYHYGHKVTATVDIINGLYSLVLECEGRMYMSPLMSDTSPINLVYDAAVIRLLSCYMEIATGQIDQLFQPWAPRASLHWWEIFENENGYVLKGCVHGHFRLHDSTRITTTPIQKYRIDHLRQELVCHTDNTVYHCPLSECRWDGCEYAHTPELEPLRGIYEPMQELIYKVENNSAVLFISDHCERYFERFEMRNEEGKRYLAPPFNDPGSRLATVKTATLKDRCVLHYEATPGEVNIINYSVPDGYKRYIENRGTRPLQVTYGLDNVLLLNPGQRKEYELSSCLPRCEAIRMSYDKRLYPPTRHAAIFQMEPQDQ